MRVGDGQTEYQWTEDWAEIPPSESATNGWAHNGVAITASGDVISFHPGESTMMVFDSQGKLARSWQTDFTDAHGITIVNEAGVEYLWVADNGRKRAYALGYEYGEAESTGQAVKITLDGEIVQRLDRPDLPVYETGMYSPTSVAVNGANGDVWLRMATDRVTSTDTTAAGTTSAASMEKKAPVGSPLRIRCSSTRAKRRMSFTSRIGPMVGSRCTTWRAGSNGRLVQTT